MVTVCNSDRPFAKHEISQMYLQRNTDILYIHNGGKGARRGPDMHTLNNNVKILNGRSRLP